LLAARSLPIRAIGFDRRASISHARLCIGAVESAHKKGRTMFKASEPDALRKQKVLAVASGGGHWIQLTRLMPAFQDCDVAYLTTLQSYRSQVSPSRFYVINDGNMNTKLRLMVMAVRVAAVLLRERPHVVISTGAAPGYFAVRLGKLIGARTIWVDSMANAEKLSLSGRRAGAHADLWLTQWPHLATPEGPHYEGAVL
jgi:UDP-N-acetylglucosamine:LPS N-acetylglucosamine transferase